MPQKRQKQSAAGRPALPPEEFREQRSIRLRRRCWAWFDGQAAAKGETGRAMIQRLLEDLADGKITIEGNGK